MNNKKINMFLEKSFQDTWNDYQYSLSSARAVVWDWIFVTASNESQAVSYRLQIEERLNSGYLPKRTKYIVLPDPDGKRIGSGGATLNVLKYISEHAGNSDKNIVDSKILVIHSGGDSRRIPQYSACGKLFSPVPKLLPDGRRSMLFDEIIISLAAIPNRMNYGMLIMSGDALMMFNPLQIDLKLNKAAVAVSIK
jgi:fucokinase